MSDESFVMKEEQRRPATQRPGEAPGNGRTESRNAKSFRISKREVYNAWQRVRRKGGAGGVDGVTLEDFERNLKNNLYAVWNRMSSGSYIPRPVRRVEIPKGNGKKRPLGIPTVRDRIAQEVVRARLEKVLDPLFHEESYGFRPGRTPQAAIASCRERCLRLDWVVDVDIEQFFDTISHDLLMKAVERHCPEKWMTLYIQRWLKAGVETREGTRPSERGTPQGGVISPLLANLFLHYAFDMWIGRTYPDVAFERYADDIVIHCRSEAESYVIRNALESRFTEVGLRLHPEKTRIIYCKDSKRRKDYEHVAFTFLGYSFQPRPAKSKHREKRFTGFLPAAGVKAKAQLRSKLKAIKLFRNTSLSTVEFASRLNQITRGWLNYFTVFYRSGVDDVIFWLDYRLSGWLIKKMRLNRRKAVCIWQRIARQKPALFAHWKFRTFQG